MISPSQSCDNYSWSSSPPSYVWKCSLQLLTPSNSRDWGETMALLLPYFFFLPLLDWHLVSSSPQKPLLITTTSQEQPRVTSQWCQPDPSALLGTSYQTPWIYVCPVHLTVPKSDLPPRVSFISTPVSRAWDSQRQVLPVEIKAKKTISLLLIFFCQGPCFIQQGAHILHGLILAAFVP